MKRQHIFLLLLFSFALKAGYLVGSLLLYSDEPRTVYDQYIHGAKKNDAWWYESIARDGYAEVESRRDIGFSDGPEFHQSNWAFFPLYPLLNKATSDLFNWHYNDSAFLWSIVFSLLAIIGIYWMGTLFFRDPDRAFFATLIMFSFPFGFYFSMFYTEALYITLLVGSFLCIRFHKYSLLAVLLVPLALLRPNGVIVLLPLYLYHLEASGLLDKYHIKWNKLFQKTNLVTSLAFITGPLSFAGYCYYQYVHTGYFFAFSIAQEGWYREFSFPLLALFRQGNVVNQYNSVFAIVVILFAVYSWRKLPLSLNILVWISILLPMSSDLIHSMTRYVSVIFPLFFVFAAIIYKFRWRFAVVGILLALHYGSYYFWLIGHPIGY